MRTGLYIIPKKTFKRATVAPKRHAITRPTFVSAVNHTFTNKNETSKINCITNTAIVRNKHLDAYEKDPNAKCFVGLTFEIEQYDFNKEFTAFCPWCKYYFQIPKDQINCKIFRHANHKIVQNGIVVPGELINPHAPKHEIDRLLAQDLIIGCGGPIYFDGKIVKAVDFNT
jgi:hypothetical protein